jgi:hypothetical protein
MIRLLTAFTFETPVFGTNALDGTFGSRRFMVISLSF